MGDYIYREGKETSELLKKVHVGGETVYQEDYKVHTNRNELADDVSHLKGSVKDIDGKIPEEASDTNKLTDSQSVNQKVTTDSATFRQTWNLVNDLHLTTAATHSDIEASLTTAITTADNNDYCFVQIPTADATPTKIAHTERYKFNGTAWGYEFDVADPSSIPTSLSELSDDSTHRLVTDTEKETWNSKADPSSIPTTLSELSDDETHRLVTDTEKATWNGKAEVGTAQDKKTANTIFGSKAFATDTVNTEAIRANNIAAILALTPGTATTTLTTSPEWKLVLLDHDDKILLGKRQDNTWYTPMDLDDLLDFVIADYGVNV